MKVLSPTGLQTRPTTAKVREAVLNILGDKIQNCNWLDLCSGSGIMGCEALLKGANSVIAVELNRKTAAICEENLNTISRHSPTPNNVQMINTNVIKWLKAGFNIQKKSFKNPLPIINDHFNIIYFDPPYESNIYSIVLQELISGSWVKKESLLICECSNKLPFTPPNTWAIKDKRVYGKNSLFFLTPNLG